MYMRMHVQYPGRARRKAGRANGEYGAPTARRHCSGARGGDSDEVNGSYELG